MLSGWSICPTGKHRGKMSTSLVPNRLLIETLVPVLRSERPGAGFLFKNIPTKHLCFFIVYVVLT